MNAKLAAMSFALLYLSGCTFLGLSEQKTLKQQQVGETWLKADASNRLDILSFPTQLRGAYAYRTPINIGTAETPEWEKRYVVCAEPFADIGMSSSLEATLELINTASNTANLSSEYSRGQKRTGTITRTVEKSTINEDGTVTATTVHDYDTNSTSSSTASGKRSRDISQTLNQRATAGLDATSTVVALSGRTQYVVLARELLYRTCESAANGQLNADHVREQHKEIIAALIKMMAAEEVTAEAKKVAAEADRAAQRARLQEALFINDAAAADIGGDPLGSARKKLTEKLIGCQTKFNDISGADQRQKKIDACTDATSRQIQRLGR